MAPARWIRRHPTTAAAAALTACWAYLAAGPTLLGLALAAAALAAAVALLRRHRAVAWSVLLAGTSTLALAAAALWAMATPSGAAQALAAALTGCAIAAPVPALAAWIWRPTLTRPLPAAIAGTTAIGGTAAGAALTGSTAWVPAALLAQLAAGAVGNWIRHRRAAGRILAGIPRTSSGWYTLDPHCPGDPQILYRRGAAITVLPTPHPQPGPAARAAAVRAAAAAARAMGLPPARVQPVLTCAAATIPSRLPGVWRHHRAQVMLTHPARIADIASAAPTHLPTRRPLLRIAHTRETSRHAQPAI